MKRDREILHDAIGLGGVPLSAIFIALASYAILITPLHHHVDLGIHTDCSICKFAEILSSSDKVDVYAVGVPQLQYLSFDSEGVIRIPSIVTAATSTRAPPHVSSKGSRKQNKNIGT